jgi:hypothetical protein
MRVYRRLEPENDEEAVRKLIAEIDELDKAKNAVFRRIWLVVLLVFPLAILLFVMVALLKH